MKNQTQNDKQEKVALIASGTGFIRQTPLLRGVATLLAGGSTAQSEGAHLPGAGQAFCRRHGVEVEKPRDWIAKPH